MNGADSRSQPLLQVVERTRVAVLTHESGPKATHHPGPPLAAEVEQEADHRRLGVVAQ